MGYYRTPSKGTTETSRRIAEAVDDDAWQKFRYSLKGMSTDYKLRRLRDYLISCEDDKSKVRLRVDNYLKALARGGQIAAQQDDYVMHLVNGTLTIRK